MGIFHNKKNLRSIKNRMLVLLGILLFLLMIQVQINGFNNLFENSPYVDEIVKDEKDVLNLASESSILFEGIENSLTINDTGNLYELNQEIILENELELNRTYEMDVDHSWKVSKIDVNISDIQDTRNWVMNDSFIPIGEIFTVNQVVENDDHPYKNRIDKGEEVHTITHTGAIAMRVHFKNISFEENWDFVGIYDSVSHDCYADTGYKTDFYSPWVKGEQINIYLISDASNQDYGFYIDFYEFCNESSDYYLNNYSWGFNDGAMFSGDHGPGNIANNDAMYVALHYDWDWDVNFDYWSRHGKNSFVEIYQNLTIPRSKVVDGYISFDYYPEFCMESNDIFIYAEINNKRIFSKGFSDIVNDEGINQWHSTGKYFIDYWINTSKIFESVVSEQELNVSIGIKSIADSWYSGFDNQFQQVVWFDNITLGLTTIVNSTQDGVNLTVNEFLLPKSKEWGQSSLTLNKTWDTKPYLIFNTSSPSLSFILNTTLFGYRNITSFINQEFEEGVKYKILSNGSILWEFYHNFYTPQYYEDFEFLIYKPVNWEFLTVLDPTGTPRPYENGKSGDNLLRINKTHAQFPGWWKFVATSPNYLNESKTSVIKVGEGIKNRFSSGDSIIIKTQVNHSGEIPSTLGSTSVNLTIYHPNGTIWYEETTTPETDGSGNVTFTEIEIGSHNTTGGYYNYTLFWSNGTALGGIKSEVLIIHNSSLSLLKPNDAISDLSTDGYLGDIIPLRIEFKDSENNNPISDAFISYNLTTGIEYFEEAALGIYEAIIDTSIDLGSIGTFEIFINSSVSGFKSSNFTLKVSLNKETSLLRVLFENTIEMHNNVTVKFIYKEKEGGGITNAEINVSIDKKEYYTIKNHLDGNYTIEINTSYIDTLGTYQIDFNFSAPYYEPQINTYQFEITEQSVNMSVYLDSKPIDENSLVEIMFKEEINISVRVEAAIDKEFLSGGNVTWNGDNLFKNLTLCSDFWFNTSIKVSADNFSDGINDVYLQFVQDNYKVERFRFQLLVQEQSVNISVYINSQEIDENSLLEVTFKEVIKISAKVYAIGERIYLPNGFVIFSGENYKKSLSPVANDWYNISITISSTNFTTGINQVYLQFSQENYTRRSFSFQFLASEQSVDLSVYINSQEITENTLLEATFEQSINLAARVYATVDKKFLSSGSIKFISGNYEKSFIESPTSWYGTLISFSKSHFTTGANIVYIKFQLENYTTNTFSFQILIKEQTINMTAYINSQKVSENSLIEVDFNDQVNISAKAYAMTEGKYLSDGNMTFICGNYKMNIHNYGNNWYNTSISFSPSDFSLGLNYAYIKFYQDSYQNTTFTLQILVNQIEIDVIPIDFEDNIDFYVGDDVIIKLRLRDPTRNEVIEGATVSYSWEFGIGTLIESGNGTYELNLEVPTNVQGNYKITLIVSKEGSVFKAKEYSFFLSISERELPDYLIWIIIGTLLTALSVLTVLSLRSYVFIPRRRRKESELLYKTQRFKDLENIQAVVVIHKLSGIPIFLKSYSILEKHKRELFAGFIQAITTISQEFTEVEDDKAKVREVEKTHILEKIIELDFKYFYCLIADRDLVRIVLILKNHASERLKEQVGFLLSALSLKLSEELENWDGSIDEFEMKIPEILNEYFELFYKEEFKVNTAEYIAKNRKEGELSSMETQVLNVIYSIAKGKKPFSLDDVFKVIYGENRDLIIEAIESLIARKIIIPSQKESK